MTQETQQRILALISRASDEASTTLGHEAFSFESVLGFLRTNWNKSIFEVILAICQKAVPGISSETSLRPEDIPLALAFFDTREEAADLLLQLPEPDPIMLDRILGEITTAWPAVLRVLEAFVQGVSCPPEENTEASGSLASAPGIRNELSGLEAEQLRLPDLDMLLMDHKHVRMSVTYQLRRQIQKPDRNRNSHQE
ncbi:MAG TPA: hypothetical protein VHZ09_13695 [Acidobacteriaceae bacterium]|nr:hypothetical protein [Acidobacteriaceae bacterium]